MKDPATVVVPLMVSTPSNVRPSGKIEVSKEKVVSVVDEAVIVYDTNSPILVSIVLELVNSGAIQLPLPPPPSTLSNAAHTIVILFELEVSGYTE